MIDIGVARPSAQGQAMMSTATALIRPEAQPGSRADSAPGQNVTTATPITAGTNQAATRSARRWIGARLRWAWATIWTICASTVSRADRSRAHDERAARVHRPADHACRPARFATGIGSPVSIDSSTALLPSMTTPSTGTFSPGRTRSTSPGWT